MDLLASADRSRNDAAEQPIWWPATPNLRFGGTLKTAFLPPHRGLASKSGSCQNGLIQIGL
jgi:hypothetical protein